MREPKILIAMSLLLTADGHISSLLPKWIDDFNDFIIGPLLFAGSISIALAVTRGENDPFKRLLAGFIVPARVLVAFYLFTLIIVIGLLLFIIPGLIWTSRYAFALYGVMDRSLPVRESFRFSRQLTTGHIRNLIGAVFLSQLPLLLCTPLIFGQLGWGPNEGRSLLVLGALPYGVSLFIFYPWISAVWAVIYYDLSGSTETPMATPLGTS